MVLFKIVKKVEEDGAWKIVGGKSTSSFWQVVAADVEIQMPGRGATSQDHYYALLVDLEKYLPAGEFEALADKLKEKGARLGQWTMDEKLVLFKIVKKVEEDGASASDGANLRAHCGRWSRRR